MYELRNISKMYKGKKSCRSALFAISMKLPDTGLVLVVGPSGAGKTTLLNILGGLDRIDSGELYIDGELANQFTEKRWDRVRNSLVGSVFQDRAFIDYRNVAANISLPLELNGLSKEECISRVRSTMKLLGIEHLASCMPSELSNEDAQVVSVARAIANNPAVILADEPTSEMENERADSMMAFLKRFSKNHLVIVAARSDQYASLADCVIELESGRVVNDNACSISLKNAVKPTQGLSHRAVAAARKKLSFARRSTIALMKIRDKSTRGFASGIAGMVGIFGIAFCLAVVVGVQNYANMIESETLRAFPIELNGSGYNDSLNISQTSLLEELTDGSVSSVVANVAGKGSNDLKSFKEYLESNSSHIRSFAEAVEYRYPITPKFYLSDTSQGAIAINPNVWLDVFNALSQFSNTSKATVSLSGEVFHALPSTDSLYKDSYEVLEGRWPESETECVVVLNKNGEINDSILYSLGLLDINELPQIVINSILAKVSKSSSSSSGDASAGSNGTSDTSVNNITDSKMTATSNLQSSTGSATTPLIVDSGAGKSYEYKDLLGERFKLVCAADLYTRDTLYGGWKKISADSAEMNSLVTGGQTVNIVGVVKPTEDTFIEVLDFGVSYPSTLVPYLAKQSESKAIVAEQLASSEVDVLSGLKFEDASAVNILTKIEGILEGIEGLIKVKVGQFKGTVTLTVDTLATALGVSKDFLTNVIGIGEDDIELSLTQVLTKLEQQGYDYSSYPEPTDEDFAIIDIENPTAKNKKDIGDAAEVILANCFGNFPYVFAFLETGEITAELFDWLFDTYECILDGGYNTGLTPVEYMQVALEETLGVEVDYFEAEEFMLWYFYNSFPEYLSLVVDDVLSLMSDVVLNTLGNQLNPSFIPLLKEKMSSVNLNVKALFDVETLMNQVSYLLGTINKEYGKSVTQNLNNFGYASLDTPSVIAIYPAGLEQKVLIEDEISDYNKAVEKAEEPEKIITYTDPIGSFANIVNAIVRIITLFPILFISLSVIVCALMVGVASGLAAKLRRKEFGIMRAFGASRADIRRMILTEAGYQGFISGLLGVAIVWIICAIVNKIIKSTLGIVGLMQLPLGLGALLILVNIVLILISTFGPAVRGGRTTIVQSIFH